MYRVQMFQCQWPCFDQQRGYFINLSSSTNNTVNQYMYNVREFTCLHNLVDPPPPPPPQSYLLKLFLMNIRTLLMKLPRLFSSSELFFQTESDQLNALSWSRYRKRNSQLICETAILKSTNEVHVDSLLYSIEKWIFIQIPSKRGRHKL